MKQIFILGQNPALSMAEILTTAKSLKILVKVEAVTTEFLIIEVTKQLPISQLGGTVKTGIIIDEVPRFELELFTGKVLAELVSLKMAKIWFGFSFYPISLSGRNKLQQGMGGQVKSSAEKNFSNPQVYGVYGGKNNKAQTKDLGMTIKRRLELQNIASRFVVSRGQQLSSVIVQKEHLLDKGREFLVATAAEKTYLGYTLEVQEFEDYGERDFGRPSRDIKSGMLPPKLAKMMLNLAGVNGQSNILDPFCGSGTILQEAILLGCRQVYGTDMAAKAVSDSQRNLNWLKTKQLKLSSVMINVWQSEVKYLAKYFEENKVSAIITEPYLGPALKNQDVNQFRNNPLKLQMIVKEVEQLCLLAVRVFTEILVENGVVVMIWPQWQIGNKIYQLEILSAVLAVGFELINPLAGASFPFREVTARKTIIYRRPDQAVGREIIILRKIIAV